VAVPLHDPQVVGDDAIESMVVTLVPLITTLIQLLSTQFHKLSFHVTQTVYVPGFEKVDIMEVVVSYVNPDEGEPPGIVQVKTPLLLVFPPPQKLMLSPAFAVVVDACMFIGHWLYPAKDKAVNAKIDKIRFMI